MARQPNIIIFISDQQRTDTMVCYGNDWIQSPHMNALSERSFVFENTYVAQAVCTPARGSLMTGLYPHSHGCVVNNVPLREDTKSIAEMLPNTYRKAHFGKWHLGEDVFCQHGFDEWAATEDGRKPRYKTPNPPFSPYHEWLIEQGHEPETSLANGEKHFGPKQRAKLPPEHQMAAYVANRSDTFIRETVEQPWLLVFSTFEPHPPFTGPYDGLYDPDELPLGPAFHKHPEGHSRFNRVRSEFYPVGPKDGNIIVEDLSTEAGYKKQRAQYFGNVKIIDDAVGKLVQALEETGQMDNTIIAFTSDHGDMAGDHRMWEKRAFYEEASRVPFLLSVPWLNKEQKRIPGVFGQVDLVPTLLDLAEVPIDNQCQGESVAQALTGDRDLTEHVAFQEWNGLGDRNLGSPEINLMVTLPWRTCITGNRWKLNLCAGDQCELFDLNTDPHELNNLFDLPEHRDRIRDMAARIRIWQHETNDTAPLPSV